jgi:hypothetical protein
VLEISPTLGNQLDPRANRGPSNFDGTHRFVLSYVWKSPGFAGAQSPALRRAFSNWAVSGIVSAMSGLPIDIVDGGAGSFYGLNGCNNPLARPNWTAGTDRTTALTVHTTCCPGNQPIPSSHGHAIANATGTDIGDVGRNVLRGPAQRDVDIAVTKRFPLGESRTAKLHAEFFNLFNPVNLTNPVSNVNAASSFSNTGAIVAPGDFGRIVSTSSNPRLIQLALKLNW